MNKKMFLIGFLVILVLSLTACAPSAPIRHERSFYFNDTGSLIENDKTCRYLCENLEGVDTYNGQLKNYRCDYEPVICESGECICKTY